MQIKTALFSAVFLLLDFSKGHVSRETFRNYLQILICASLFSDAKLRKNLAKQIIRGKLARNSTKRFLRQT